MTLLKLQKELQNTKDNFKMAMDIYKIDYENNRDDSDYIYYSYESKINDIQYDISMLKAIPLLMSYGIEIDE